jgi:hypothetical protein
MTKRKERATTKEEADFAEGMTSKKECGWVVGFSP